MDTVTYNNGTTGNRIAAWKALYDAKAKGRHYVFLFSLRGWTDYRSFYAVVDDFGNLVPVEDHQAEDLANTKQALHDCRSAFAAFYTHLEYGDTIQSLLPMLPPGQLLEMKRARGHLG